MATKTQGMRIRTKLLGMIFMLILIFLTIGTFTIFGLFTTTQTFQPHLLPSLSTVYNMELFLAKAQQLGQEAFVPTPENNIAEFREKQKATSKELAGAYNLISRGQNTLRVDDYDSTFSNLDVRGNLINDVRASFNGTMNTLRPLTTAVNENQDLAGYGQQLELYQNSVENLQSSITRLKSHISLALEKQRQASEAFAQTKLVILAGVAAAILVIGLLVGLLFSRSLSKSLNTLMQGVEAIGQGNFTEIKINSKDEFAEIARIFNETADRMKDFIRTDEQRQATEENVINFLEVVSEASEGNLTLRAPVTEDSFGTIADSYNLMIESLANLLTDTTINAEEVGEESRQLLEIFQTMKEGADSQLQYVATATDAAEETTRSAAQIAEKTSLAQQSTTKVDDATTLGNESVNRNIEGMQLIRVTVQVINKKMKSLAERLLEIGTISQLISDVATRTTILAMNASIEASRAGEQGRGFLVISDEIKRLADEASEATREIGGIIKAIQSEANEVTLALEEETSTVEEQTRIAQETGEALAAINKATSDSKQVVEEINKLAQEQQKISDGMLATIRQVADITADTSAMVTTSSQISEGLDGVSESLLQSLSQFRLSAPEAPVPVIEEPQLEEPQLDAQDIVNEIFASSDALDEDDTGSGFDLELEEDQERESVS